MSRPPACAYVSLHALLLVSSAHISHGFRFGGHHGRIILPQNDIGISNRQEASSSPSPPAATKGSGGDTSSPAESRDTVRTFDDDESFHSIINDMVEDIKKVNAGKVSGEIELDDDDNNNDNDAGIGRASRRPNGRRVTFFASKEATRTLSLDDRYSRLLDEYMTLPLEQYSVKSFHDEDPGSRMEGRRWFLRRLDAEESLQYREYEPRDNHEDYMRNGGLSGGEYNDGAPDCAGHGRFFRLAVPLAPLIGVELTPVIDLEVIPALKPSEGTEASDAGALELPRRSVRRPLRAVRRGVVRIQSLRVSLLSTEDEVKALMQTRQRASKPIDKPTQVSQNPSVQQIGTEAIGVVGRVEQAIEPHITFDATITWDQLASSGPSVTVKSTAVTSLTIPKKAMAFRVPLPLPLGLLVRRIGSLLTKKALEISLPRFLRQLERDLERWARGGEDDER
eukprot:CAMPEP_0185826160 /NCGR_PEP_ID=MMETSP1322-20130828/31410_1 /TAXON_ID=265543 /ORGANISM="Minutocellus polymorphus, Strain RCC2270" /LENGTH=450 /DNA_ID=CAMNT_0028523885 /DNA_START=42 /DNA_END=1394 /DNA_ORIENTATION=-